MTSFRRYPRVWMGGALLVALVYGAIVSRDFALALSGLRQSIEAMARGEHLPAPHRDDEIGDVVEVSADSFECPPPTLRGPIRTLVEGAYKLPQGLLLVLNTNEAVNVSNSESGQQPTNRSDHFAAMPPTPCQPSFGFDHDIQRPE